MKKETWIENQISLKEKYSDYSAESQTITISKLIKELSKSINPEGKVLIEVRDEAGEYHYYPIMEITRFYGKEEGSVCISGKYI